jgi:hypothetical protein
MKAMFGMSAGAVLLGGVASAAELPSYELAGFPITSHQWSVVESANIKEQSPSSSLTMAGMPVSPHQVAVLTPRPRATATIPITTVSFSTRAIRNWSSTLP